ncbi:helix-turn-helix transcriptional regulator [Tranquillimonas alkanivorans]|uniref:DNA-binding transcriptional regulator, CsgD family n=1 Tax=Tranquillimonas alkanivorans TaxID=441119 RepID=A0A1I5PQP3_9RHOB|nr:LuxR family transcriptional regulator [Tranquillimonas alkanivorans]SFP36319.1 DNA-binding transcriptional regulator, CsgD family [Tranquillimonas alkanivorans]
MQRKTQAAIEALEATESLDELSGFIHRLRDILEVEHLVYHAVNGTGGQYAALTYSADWVARYVAEDYARIDPVVLEAQRRFRPVDWSKLDWSNRTARAFKAEALDAGLGRQGFSLPIRGPAGQFALFSVNHRCPAEEWQRLTESHLPDLILLGHHINQRALTIERGSDKVPSCRLSPREIDALTLLAAGRNRSQAAETLTISEHTLRVYIESARFKLGANNTVHAVAMAMNQGLLLL